MHWGKDHTFLFNWPAYQGSQQINKKSKSQIFGRLIGAFLIVIINSLEGLDSQQQLLAAISIQFNSILVYFEHVTAYMLEEKQSQKSTINNKKREIYHKTDLTSSNSGNCPFKEELAQDIGKLSCSFFSFFYQLTLI